MRSVVIILFLPFCSYAQPMTGTTIAALKTSVSDQFTTGAMTIFTSLNNWYGPKTKSLLDTAVYHKTWLISLTNWRAATTTKDKARDSIDQVLLKKRVSDSLANRQDTIVAKVGQLILKQINKKKPFKYEINADPIMLLITSLQKDNETLKKRVTALEAERATKPRNRIVITSDTPIEVIKE